MIFFKSKTAPLLRVSLLTSLALWVLSPQAQAQSFCASDGQPTPVQLMERFINADCETCWSDPATPAPGARVVALDWVVPGTRGDDAALSAVATQDALTRLDALRKSIPAKATAAVHKVKGLPGAVLRVAHGVPTLGYLGASIEVKPIAPSAKQPLSAWLALVETLPAGTEGTPLERNLVRNLLLHKWDGRKQLLKGEQNRLFEARAMGIAPAANPERLRVMGWIEDEKGQVLAAAESRCVVPRDEKVDSKAMPSSQLLVRPKS